MDLQNCPIADPLRIVLLLLLPTSIRSLPFAMIRCLWSSFRFQLKTNNLRSKNSHADGSQKANSKVRNSTRLRCVEFVHLHYVLIWLLCHTSNLPMWEAFWVWASLLIILQLPSLKRKWSENVMQSMCLHLLIKLIAGSFLWVEFRMLFQDRRQEFTQLTSTASFKSQESWWILRVIWGSFW